MAGTILERELTARRPARIRFATATAADDADIRRLLRETPMRGRIRVALEREPDYFADAHQPGEIRETIIARAGEEVVCMGSCTVRSCFVNDAPRRVGYLGGLRLAGAFAGRADILRRGYAFFRRLQVDNPADYYFTGIAADNGRAQRFLESSAPGMPRYEFISEFVTLFIAAAGRPRLDEGREYAPALDELAARINDRNQHYQFAPRWTVADITGLEPLGLTRDNFCCVREGGRVVGEAALWDQRSYKQTVIQGYSPLLAVARPVLNLVSLLRRQPCLPGVGATLKSAVVSHLFAASDRPAILTALLNQLRSKAAARGLDLLMLGFDARDPRLVTVRRAFPAREYRSRFYVVRWPALGGSASELDGRPIAPELALL